MIRFSDFLKDELGGKPAGSGGRTPGENRRRGSETPVVAEAHPDFLRNVLGKIPQSKPRIRESYDHFVQYAEGLFKQIASGTVPDPLDIDRHLDSLIEEVAGWKESWLAPIYRNDPEQYLDAHRVNVTILSILAGMWSGYNKTKLGRLALGALLTREAPAAAVRWKPEEAMPEFERIVEVMDVYDELIHSRPHRKRLTPSEAMKEILARRDSFSPPIVKILLERIGMYPPGTWVRLSTGEKARVLRVNKGYLFRPVVTVFFTRRSEMLSPPRTVDLSNQAVISIERSLDEDEFKINAEEGYTA